MIKGVKHIIFDLGGVLINLDYRLTEQAFTDLGIVNFNELYSQIKQNSFFDEWETGKIDRAAFVIGLQKACGLDLSEEQIMRAWNAMLMDFPLRRLQLLQQLRLYYDLALLSNTNEVHEAEVTRIVKDAHGQVLAAFFDKVYYSHRVGMRKPSEEIFKYVLEDNGWKAEDTLFIDDSPQHVETARALGLKTIYLEPGMTIEKDIFRPLNQESKG
jgi:putative hydrolase of the HAD superfamily